MPTLEQMILDAGQSAEWLRASDQAVIRLASIYARRVDKARADFLDGAIDNTQFSQATYIQTHIKACLKNLGFSPETRKELLATTALPGSEPVRSDAETLVDALEIAFANMPWLTQFDRAQKRIALDYAERIDYATREFYEDELISSTEYNKSLYLGPHLLNTLRDLGGTPAGREAIIGSEDSNEALPLDELKRKRLQKQRAERASKAVKAS